MSEWYELKEPEAVASPAVLVYRDRLIANIESAVAVAGGPEYLRPHVKTHKSLQVARLHLERGIVRFKCATVREAQMLAEAGAPDVLIAYQPVGPTADALFAVARRHREVRFACVVDNPGTVGVLEVLAEKYGIPLRVYVDLDVGMHRTGIAPGPAADDLYAALTNSRWLEAGGIHAYDGHVHASDSAQRSREAEESRGLALATRDRLQRRGITVPEVVLSGTPGFTCHAEALGRMRARGGPQHGVTLSPGTYAYFDWRSAARYTDLPFQAAALVLGRVISVPAPGRFTIDVGNKAIAADPEPPVGTILNIPEATAGPQSEEHWVFTVTPSRTPPVGSCVYVWPAHICPTIARYDEVNVVSTQRTIAEVWEVTARGRSIEKSPGVE